MKQRSNEEVLEMLDYLAWKVRVSSFEDDFKNKIRQWYFENTKESPFYITIMCGLLWASYSSKGLVETYQEYIQDKDVCKVLCHAVNTG
jgi:hypothetical protein